MSKESHLQLFNLSQRVVKKIVQRKIFIANINLSNIYVQIHSVRMKSSTQQKVSQLFQNCKYLPEISNSITLTILTRDRKAVWKYSRHCQIYERLRWNTEKLKFPT